MRSRASAQERLFPAGENSGQVEGVEIGGAVANPIDASVDGKKRSSTDSHSDRLRSDSRAHKLTPRHYSVLVRRDPTDDGVRCGHFGPHEGSKWPRRLIHPPLPAVRA